MKNIKQFFFFECICYKCLLFIYFDIIGFLGRFTEKYRVETKDKIKLFLCKVLRKILCYYFRAYLRL